jgi:predicted phosphodiesterase
MERIAVISDIHGNSPALRAVLADIQQENCSRLFVLGDIINGFDPKGCLELLRAWNEPICLKGNAEAYLLTPNPETIPAADQNRQTELIQLIQWYRSHLSGNDLEWLQSLPDYLTWNGACFVHDSPLDRLFPEYWHVPGVLQEHQEWLYHSPGIPATMAESEWEKLLHFMETHHLNQVFCGHTHVPFQRCFGEKLICNAGSVGLPLDGDPRPAWVMLEGEPGEKYRVFNRRIDYDLEPIFRLVDETLDYPGFESMRMKAAYQQCLKTGIIWRKPSP